MACSRDAVILQRRGAGFAIRRRTHHHRRPACPAPTMLGRRWVGGGTMNPLHFWAEPHRWPRDPIGYVFLARVVEAIGRARFGNEWTGKEVTTKVVAPLPSRETASPGDRFRALEILMRHHPESKRPYPESKRPSDEAWLAECWPEAQAAARHEQEAQRALFQRLGTVQDEIVRRCESGELVSAIRKAGGEMETVPREWWNTESWPNRFVFCQLKPSDPSGLGVTGERFCWIFVTSASLDRYLNSQPFAPAAANIDVHLSPYMKTMLAVAKRLNITAENWLSFLQPGSPIESRHFAVAFLNFKSTHASPRADEASG